MPECPPIGSTLVYYLQGDTNSPPMPALVQDNAGGVLELATFPKYSETIKRRANVRHVGDPILQDRQNIRVQYGAWETIEEADGRRVENERKQREAVRLREEKRKANDAQQRKESDGDTAEIIRLRQTQNLNATEIAEEMTKNTNRNWSHQKVNAILRNHGQLVAS